MLVNSVFIKWNKEFYDKYRDIETLQLWEITHPYPDYSVRLSWLKTICNDYFISTDFNGNEVLCPGSSNEHLFRMINFDDILIQAPKPLVDIFSDLVTVPVVVDSFLDLVINSPDM